MDYIIAADTDAGISRESNQDSVMLKTFHTTLGKMAFGVLCDGLGGLAKGELASASVVRAFDAWAMRHLPGLCVTGLQDGIIRREWEDLLSEQNRKIKEYGRKNGVNLGTTVVVILLTEDRYYILNIGDSRVYELSDHIEQLTSDQTYVNREVSQGNMTLEEAASDPRRNILLQCVGASDKIYPEMYFGETKKNTVYLLCSDGFRHEITKEEIYDRLCPENSRSQEQMTENCRKLIALNMEREEQDNITVGLIRTF